MKMTLYYVAYVYLDKEYNRHGDYVDYVAGPFASRSQAYDAMEASNRISDNLRIVEHNIEVTD